MRVSRKQEGSPDQFLIQQENETRVNGHAERINNLFAFYISTYLKNTPEFCILTQNEKEPSNRFLKETFF
jgi:hypothetical protein